MASVTSMVSSEFTTELVVAWPTPSAPPSTASPVWQAMVMKCCLKRPQTT